MNAKKIIAVGCFANVAEWYDFSIYAFLATTIGTLFLNTDQPKIALIKAFFWFTISYIARPIGSVFWGYCGDRYGRKVALRWCLMLMAVPTVLIGMLPTYDSIGVLASICLIIFRLIQGFAAGGELPISSCYVYEVSPPEKRNFFCSIVAASSMIGVLLGSLTAFLVYAFFTPKEILLYAWRLPFLFGFFVLLLILYIRRNIDETGEFERLRTQSKSFLQHFFSMFSWHNIKKMSQIIMLYAFIQSTLYLLFVWMPSYLNVFLSISKNESFLSNTIGMFCLVVFTLIVGHFADRIQHKKIIIFSIVSIAIVTFPFFLLLRLKVFLLTLFVQICFAACLGCIEGVMVNTLVRGFDNATRCSSVNIAFTLPSAIFGGILPTLCSYLIYITGYNLIPVFVLVSISLATLLVVIKSKTL